MTTIAYSHKTKTIAYDSRLTRGETICTDSFDKKLVKGDSIFVFAGVLSDAQAFIDHYPNFQENYTYNCRGVAVIDGKARIFNFNKDGEYEESILSFDEAWGSGQDHALTAMDLGCSAKKAVECAIKRDVSSGGEVRVIRL